MGTADAAAEDGKVLRVDVDEAPVNGPVTCDHAVAENLLVGETEILRIVSDKDVQFAETALVKQEI